MTDLTELEELEFSNSKNAELKDYLLSHTCEGFLKVALVIKGRGYKRACVRTALQDVLDGEYFVKIGRSQFVTAAKTKKHAMDMIKRIRFFEKSKNLTMLTMYSTYNDFRDFFEVVDL